MDDLAVVAWLCGQIINESLSIHAWDVLENRQDLDFVVQYFYLETAIGYEGNYLGQGFVGVLLTVANAADADGGQLPEVVVVNFGDRDVKLVGDPGCDRFQNLSLAFQGLVFRNTEANLADTNVHSTKIVNGE